MRTLSLTPRQDEILAKFLGEFPPHDTADELNLARHFKCSPEELRDLKAALSIPPPVEATVQAAPQKDANVDQAASTIAAIEGVKKLARKRRE